MTVNWRSSKYIMLHLMDTPRLTE